jgi:uncharacterized protein
MFAYIIMLVVLMGIGFMAQRNVTGTFNRYAQVPTSAGRSGADVARAILDANGLHNVEIVEVEGELSDHYDPRTRRVALSPLVFRGQSIASSSVAAHEVGHAMQHALGYVPLKMRSAFFPVAAFSSNATMPLLMLGMIAYMIGAAQLGTWAFLVAIVLFAFAVLFQLITLPVEFDASRRAKVQLQQMGFVGPQEADGVSSVLTAAALTYVVAALAAVVQLVWLVMSFMRD